MTLFKLNLTIIDHEENSEAVATYIREYGIDAMLVVCNVSENYQTVTVPLTEGMYSERQKITLISFHTTQKKKMLCQNQ